MKQRPILFSDPMVRALLDGSKTQTRRVMKPQPIADQRFSGGYYIPASKRTEGAIISVEAPYVGRACPYGQVGDQLWVRETFLIADEQAAGLPPWVYAADYSNQDRPKTRWKPSIFMPRAASRITLEITGVRVKRLQDISEADAIAEGTKKMAMVGSCDSIFPHPSFPQVHDRGTYKFGYQVLWESLNGAGSWDLNPWVWVIEIKKVMP